MLHRCHSCRCLWVLVSWYTVRPSANRHHRQGRRVAKFARGVLSVISIDPPWRSCLLNLIRTDRGEAPCEKRWLALPASSILSSTFLRRRGLREIHWPLSNWMQPPLSAKIKSTKSRRNSTCRRQYSSTRRRKTVSDGSISSPPAQNCLLLVVSRPRSICRKSYSPIHRSNDR